MKCESYVIPSTLFAVGNDVITPVCSVRDLASYIDSDLSMRMHISRTVSACFVMLRQIRSIRRSVTRPVLQSLVAALTLTELDYGCSMMASLSMRLDSSRLLMHLLDSSTQPVEVSMCLHFSVISTGFEFCHVLDQSLSLSLV